MKLVANIYAERYLFLTGLIVALTLVYRGSWRIRTLKARRNYLMFRGSRLATVAVLYAGTLLALASHEVLLLPAVILGTLFSVLTSKVVIRPPKRSRHIPAKVRRKVIRRDLGSERIFDSRIHALDHRVPYSRGGENTIQNLRVLSRVENARKRDRMPTREDYKQKALGRSRKYTLRRFFWFALDGALSTWALLQAFEHYR